MCTCKPSNKSIRRQPLKNHKKKSDDIIIQNTQEQPKFEKTTQIVKKIKAKYLIRHGM